MMAQSVGILTFHHADNYGAVLQAYGLVRAIQALGHAVEIVDYRPIAARRGYNRFGLRSGMPIQVLLRRWRFHQFRRKYLPLTSRKYYSPKALAQAPPHVDCCICGSDQIWNVQSYRGFDPPFFLDFVHDSGVTKASYAATFGGATDVGPHRERIADLLRAFDHLSVRDLHSQTMVNDIIGQTPPRVLDPSFLADFEPLTPPPLYSQPYILAFPMERTLQFSDVTVALGRQLGLKIVSVGSAIEGSDRYISAGPQEWLSLVKHARMIVTNSFHGVCFSINFRKDFVVVPRNANQMRITDLLTWFHLTDRVIADKKALDAWKPDKLQIDYSRTEGLLREAIEDSRSYLREVLHKQQV